MSDVLLKTTGEIIGHFNAFKGSRPAFHGEHVVIVRGISRDPIEINDMEAKLGELEQRRIAQNERAIGSYGIAC